MRFHWLYGARGPTVEYPDSPALSALIEKANAIARAERVVVLRLEPNIADDDSTMDDWLAAYHALGFQINPTAVHGRRSWVLDIRPSDEELLANFKMTWRQNVRVAERKGVIIREAKNEADFDAYYELLKTTSERDAFLFTTKSITRKFYASSPVKVMPYCTWPSTRARLSRPRC